MTSRRFGDADGLTDPSYCSSGPNLADHASITVTHIVAALANRYGLAKHCGSFDASRIWISIHKKGPMTGLTATGLELLLIIFQPRPCSQRGGRLRLRLPIPSRSYGGRFGPPSVCL